MASGVGKWSTDVSLPEGRLQRHRTGGDRARKSAGGSPRHRVRERRSPPRRNGWLPRVSQSFVFWLRHVGKFRRRWPEPGRSAAFRATESEQSALLLRAARPSPLLAARRHPAFEWCSRRMGYAEFSAVASGCSERRQDLTPPIGRTQEAIKES